MFSVLVKQLLCCCSCGISPAITLKAREIPYPHMVLSEYLWLVSTYRPPELGQDENYTLYLVARGTQSAYDMVEELKKAQARRREWSKKYRRSTRLS